MTIPRQELWKKLQPHLEAIIIEASNKAKEKGTDLLIHPHSQNTLKWGLKINPAADTALKIALLGHDIERAYPDRIVKKPHDYDPYKAEHSQHSAEKLKVILTKFDADELLIGDVYILVSYHDVLFTAPKNADMRLLKNLQRLRAADGISYLDVQFREYLKKEGVLETAKKVQWTNNRLEEIRREEIGSYPKDAEALYETRKQELFEQFKIDTKNRLRIKGSVDTQGYLDYMVSNLVELFSSEELNPIVKTCFDMIDKKQKAVEEKFYASQ